MSGGDPTRTPGGAREAKGLVARLAPRDDGAQGQTTLSATRGLCNVCGRLTDAKRVVEGGRVFLVKWCPEHGQTRALVSSDADWHRRAQAWVKPGTRPRSHAVADPVGCPDSCGLCARHQQHTCVPLLEITSRCDLACPICLVHGRGVPDLSLDDVRRLADLLVAREGRVNMVTLTGGEPTRHPDLLGVVDALRRSEIGVVSLSTNGLRLARDEALLAALVERDVVISLQFDGWSPETSARLRGRADLPDRKRRLVERVLALGGRLSLTYTIARGVNEGDLGDALDLLFREDGVVSLMVQPLVVHEATRAALGADRDDVVTIPEAIGRLAAASGGVLKVADFTPLPCSHPTCFALTYLLKTDGASAANAAANAAGSRAGGGLVSLLTLVDHETWADLTKNEALLATDADTLLRIRDALYGLWSSDGIVPDHDAVLRTVKGILVDLNRLGGGASHRDLLALGMRNVKSIFLHHFMDRGTFDLARAVKCCNHYPQPDGRLLPACIRNNLGDPGAPEGRAWPDA